MVFDQSIFSYEKHRICLEARSLKNGQSHSKDEIKFNLCPKIIKSYTKETMESLFLCSNTITQLYTRLLQMNHEEKLPTAWNTSLFTSLLIKSVVSHHSQKLKNHSICKNNGFAVVQFVACNYNLCQIKASWIDLIQKLQILGCLKKLRSATTKLKNKQEKLLNKDIKNESDSNRDQLIQPISLCEQQPVLANKENIDEKVEESIPEPTKINVQPLLFEMDNFLLEVLPCILDHILRPNYELFYKKNCDRQFIHNEILSNLKLLSAFFQDGQNDTQEVMRVFVGIILLLDVLSFRTILHSIDSQMMDEIITEVVSTLRRLVFVTQPKYFVKIVNTFIIEQYPEKLPKLVLKLCHFFSQPIPPRLAARQAIQTDLGDGSKILHSTPTKSSVPKFRTPSSRQFSSARRYALNKKPQPSSKWYALKGALGISPDLGPAYKSGSTLSHIKRGLAQRPNKIFGTGIATDRCTMSTQQINPLAGTERRSGGSTLQHRPSGNALLLSQTARPVRRDFNLIVPTASKRGREEDSLPYDAERTLMECQQNEEIDPERNEDFKQLSAFTASTFGLLLPQTRTNFNSGKSRPVVVKTDVVKGNAAFKSSNSTRRYVITNHCATTSLIPIKSQSTVSTPSSCNLDGAGLGSPKREATTKMPSVRRNLFSTSPLKRHNTSVHLSRAGSKNISFSTKITPVFYRSASCKQFTTSGFRDEIQPGLLPEDPTGWNYDLGEGVDFALLTPTKNSITGQSPTSILRTPGSSRKGDAKNVSFKDENEDFFKSNFAVPETPSKRSEIISPRHLSSSKLPPDLRLGWKPSPSTSSLTPEKGVKTEGGRVEPPRRTHLEINKTGTFTRQLSAIYLHDTLSRQFYRKGNCSRTSINISKGHHALHSPKELKISSNVEIKLSEPQVYLDIPTPSIQSQADYRVSPKQELVLNLSCRDSNEEIDLHVPTGIVCKLVDSDKVNDENTLVLTSSQSPNYENHDSIFAVKDENSIQAWTIPLSPVFTKAIITRSADCKSPANLAAILKSQVSLPALDSRLGLTKRVDLKRKYKLLRNRGSAFRYLQRRRRFRQKLMLKQRKRLCPVPSYYVIKDSDSPGKVDGSMKIKLKLARII